MSHIEMVVLGCLAVGTLLVLALFRRSLLYGLFLIYYYTLAQRVFAIRYRFALHKSQKAVRTLLSKYK